MRNFKLTFNLGNYNPDKTGLIMKSKFGIIDGKSEPVLSLR